MDLDIPKIMDYLRQRSLAEGKVHREARNIVAFHRSFLDTVERNGRLHEMSLILGYKMRSGKLLQDVALAPGMFSRGKLAVLPGQIKDKKSLSRLFKKQEKNGKL